VNTGEVVIADDDADIVGDALNTAARLEASCPRGQVVVGEDTWRLTRSSVTYEALGDVELKGKAERVMSFRALGMADPAEQGTPFVGRQRELELLRAAFRAAVSDRVARMAMVIGSSGVGKTRLAVELARRLAAEAVPLMVRCERSGGFAFAPIRDLLVTVADIDPDSDRDAKLAALDALFDPTIPDRERVVELLGSVIGASPAQSTEESFFAIRRAIEVLGRARPVVVVVDDVQWAEPLLLDLLEYLTEWVDDTAMLIVGLARPELRDLRPSLAEPSRRVVAVVPLEGLDPASTEELAARLLGVDELPPELVARLPESTDGNPLFVRELVRMLVDDGILSHRGNAYVLTVDVDAIAVPPTVQSLLASRVEYRRTSAGCWSWGRWWDRSSLPACSAHWRPVSMSPRSVA
jgi:predicted ATPase